MPPTRSSTTTLPPQAPPFKPKASLPHILHYTLFTFLAIICLCLIVLTPADAIYQCYITHRLTNIFIITGGYVVTFILAVLVYATRIYTNRTVLGGIPKAWIPVEKEDVGKSVRRLVVEGLGRSALIAGGARPRRLDGRGGGNGTNRVRVNAGTGANENALAVTGDGNNGEEREGLLRGFDYDIDPANPPWGVIEHPGWSAPESSLSPASRAEGDIQGQDEQGLCYRAVIRELPHLIEAKAVSLAPPDPIFTLHQEHNGLGFENEETEPLRIPDTRIVAILRRPPTMSLRSYIAHLSTLSILNPPETGLEFLSLYERARFSGRDLYESEFREMMGVFADLLRGMRFEVDQQRLIEMGLDVLPGNEDASSLGSHSESIIGPSDEEGETTEGETDWETLGSTSSRRYGYGYQGQHPYQYQYQAQYPFASPGTILGRTNSNSHLDGAGAYAGPNTDAASTSSSIRRPLRPNSHSHSQYPTLEPRTPSTHSLRPTRTNTSGTSSVLAAASVSRSRSHVPAQSQRSRPRAPRSITPASLRSGAGTGVISDSASSGSGSGSATGSVIRLADARTESVTGLPYVLGNQHP
ncbi:hypothetical protein BDW69DRAFT_177364 [Aspergillus filifer]